MSKTGMMLVEPVAIAGVTVSGGSGAANLLTPDPKEAWQAAAVGTNTIDLDLGAVTALDTIFFGFTNASATAVWTVATMTDALGTGLTVIQPAITLALAGKAVRPHALALLAATIETRYLRLIVTQGAGAAEPLFAGIALVGLRLELPYEYRSGRRPIDTGKRIERDGGGFGVYRGARKAAYRWTFSDMSDSSVEDVWQIAIALGETAPLLGIEGHEGAPLNSEVHYGLFERFEPYERADAADTRWGLSITEWI